MEYEWDPAKNRKNMRLHGIDFETAKHVFDDPNYIERIDPTQYNSYEVRYDVIGLVDNLLYVVYTERNNNIIRLISARKATTEEEKLYVCQIY